MRFPDRLRRDSGSLSQALQGLEYLNSLGFIHRDIKPANILIPCRTPLTVKLADFGLAKHNRNGKTLFKTFAGTHLYAAPEIYTRKPYTYAIDIWSLGIVALELAYGLPKARSEKFNPAQWFGRIFDTVTSLESDELADFLSESMLQLRPERRLSASDCLGKLHDIERDMLRTTVLSTHQNNSATPTENPSVLTTLMWASKDGDKRQRSPDSNIDADYSRRSAARKEPVHYTTAICSQTSTISYVSLDFSGQRGTVYESVLELLRTIQDGANGNEATDSHTTAMVQTLVDQVERLKIGEIKKHTDHDAERTILTAVTEAREFTLANFTSSDLANSMADLAHHLTQMMHLWSPDLETSHDGRVSRRSHQDQGETVRSSHVRNLMPQMDPVEGELCEEARTPTTASPARRQPVAMSEKSPSWPAEDTDKWTMDSALHPFGLTCPSALLDIVNASGCAPPSSGIAPSRRAARAATGVVDYREAEQSVILESLSF